MSALLRAYMGLRPQQIETFLDFSIQIADTLSRLLERDRSKRHQAGQHFRDRARTGQNPGLRVSQAGTGVETCARGRGCLVVGDQIGKEALTAPGVAMGTVVNLSPEQARGEELGARTDLFSFGAVLPEGRMVRLLRRQVV